jgi:DNA-binding transcriptional LysR family regulator
MHPADVLRLESDIAVQITRPTAKDMRLVKIGRLHSMPFASRTYLETHGTPKSFLELSRHHLVLQVADQLIAMEEYARMFPETPQLGTVSFRVNVSSAYYWLIARGGGIGILPTYAQAIGGMVVPIDVEGVRFVNDIWLTYHPDAARIERVRRLIDWLIEAFSPRKYPWFGEEFIHPRDLPRATGASSLASMFEGFKEFERHGIVPAAE